MEKSVLTYCQEAELPATQDDLNKPTKEFIINLITTFFKTFKIDDSAIKQPTLEQYDVIISEDRELYEEYMKIVNMFAAMNGICKNIFFSDFQVLDIVNPTPKRTAKLGKLLSNFVIYFKNKVMDLTDRVTQLEERRKKLFEYEQRTQEARERIAASVKYRESQERARQELMEQIEKLSKGIKNKKKIMEKRKIKIKNLEERNMEKMEIYKSKKSEANKVNCTTSELKAQVVESPKELSAQLEKLDKEKELKIAERDTKYETLKTKTKLLEEKEGAFSLIQKESEEKDQIIEIITEIKKFLKKLEAIQKKTKSNEASILKLEKEQEIVQNKCNSIEISKVNEKMKQKLMPLRHQITELSKNIKEAEIKNIEDQEKQREILSKKSIVDREILAFEADIEKFYEQCDKLVKENLSQEEDSYESILEAIKKTEDKENAK